MLLYLNPIAMKTNTALFNLLCRIICACAILVVAGVARLSAQAISTNQWTWVGGDSTINQYGIYGVKGVAAAANKPGARGSYMSWVDAAGNFWLFGGTGYGASGSIGYLNDIWKFDHTSYKWTWITGDSAISKNGIYGSKGVTAAGNMPGGRTVSSHWKDASGMVWIYGGGGLAHSGGYGYLSDLWKYNPVTNQWTWVAGDSISNQHGVYGTKGVSAAANKPGSGMHDNTWIDAGGNLWLFGGAAYAASGFAGNTNDLWKYTTATGQWTWILGDSTTQKNGVYGTKGTAAAANTPGVRVGSTCWKDMSGNLWLFGGAGLPASGPAAGYENDLWMFNTATSQWKWVAGDSTLNKYGVYGTQGVATAANYPSARYCTLTWIDSSNNVWMFGGQGYAASTGVGLLSDMWEYNTATGRWAWMRGDSTLNKYGVYGAKGSASAPNKPGARGIAAGWMDAAGNPWIFGGYGYAASTGIAYMNDLWGYQASASSLVFLSLPLNLLDFTASPLGNHSLLTWQTAEQPAGLLFSMQRSTDGIHWQTIGTVPVYTACHETCAYRYTDNQPCTGVNYYRLQLTGSTDHALYSKIAAVTFSSPLSLTWYTRGAQSVQVLLHNGTTEPYRLSGINGQLLLRGTLQNGQVILSPLSPGIYVLQVMTAKNTVTEKIAVQ